MKYSNYAASYLVTSKNRVIEESSSRKKLRRVSRRKYRVEYMIESKYRIVSGSSLEEALELEKTSKILKSKTTSTSKKTLKKTSTSSKKKTSTSTKKQNSSMLSDLIDTEEKELKSINTKNSTRKLVKLTK